MKEQEKEKFRLQVGLKMHSIIEMACAIAEEGGEQYNARERAVAFVASGMLIEAIAFGNPNFPVRAWDLASKAKTTADIWAQDKLVQFCIHEIIMAAKMGGLDATEEFCAKALRLVGAVLVCVIFDGDGLGGMVEQAKQASNGRYYDV